MDTLTEHNHEKHRATCGNCNRAWCEKCDPAPAALCHWCNGRGYSTAPLYRIGDRVWITARSKSGLVYVEGAAHIVERPAFPQGLALVELEDGQPPEPTARYINPQAQTDPVAYCQKENETRTTP